MLSKQELIEFVEDINSEDLSLVVATLNDLRDDPSADRRVLPYLEHLLEDKRTCLLAIPYIFGEIRWVAAQALLAEREAQGIDKPVRVLNVVQPIDMRGYSKARRAADIEGQGGVEGVLENLAILRDMGYLPMYDLILWPKAPAKKEEKVVAAAPAPAPVLMPLAVA